MEIYISAKNQAQADELVFDAMTEWIWDIEWLLFTAVLRFFNIFY